jgi:uncharacterized protein
MNKESMHKAWTAAQFRFYGELNDFLPAGCRHTAFWHSVKGRPSIKDTLEALRVPHSEIGFIFINGKGVDFSYQLRDNDRALVYPDGYKTKFKSVQRLRKNPSRPVKFILDSHLGKLVRHLRLLGFDCAYKKVFPDKDIIAVANAQNRVILTRDIGLLKNKAVEYGCWVRSPDPTKQLQQVLKKYGLAKGIKPFSLCLECNGKIRPVAKAKVISQLPDEVKKYYRRFFMCGSCCKIYWKGSHYDKLVGLIRRIKKGGA